MDEDVKKALEKYAKGPEMTIERANDYRVKLGLSPLTQEEYDEKMKRAEELNNLFDEHL